MSQWFECKVSYERQGEAKGTQKVSEIYLINAFTFTEAEERIIKEVLPFVSFGELNVVNIKKVRLAEIFFSELTEDDKYYRAKVEFIAFDEKSGTEKRSGVSMLIQSSSLSKALERLTKEMESHMGDYDIASITSTPILDVYKYEHA